MKATILSLIIWAFSTTPTVINNITSGYTHANFGGTEYVSFKYEDFDLALAIDPNSVQVKWDFDKEIVSHVK